MARSKFGINMCEGSILKNIILFALPLMASSLLQLLYNAADVVVVGRFAGSDAIASVGATGSLCSLIVQFFIGCSVGASVLVSKKYGAQDYEGVHRGVHTSMFLSVILGILVMVVGVMLSKPLLVLMGTPEGSVLNGAVLYMRIYFVGMFASFIYNFGAAVLRAVGDTKRPLYILSLTGIVNVVLNLVLVCWFHLDVAGVAIATAVANFLSALAVIYTLCRSEGVYRLFLKELKIYKDELKAILKVGLPAGIQGSVFGLSNTTIQSAVNSFGPVAMAGNAAGANIEGFVYVAMNAFYQACLTSVSQNYGAKNKKRVNKTISVSMICAAITGIILGGLSAIFARPLLGIYITDSPEAIEYGVVRIAYTGLPYFMCGIMEVLAGGLRGLGYSGTSTVNSLVGACGLRILWVWLVLPLCRTQEMLFLCWPVSWIVVILMHAIALHYAKKKTINLLS
ncbi:MAG: MATE family efflux transporter [Clostridia bacterium]|nr:MATE family efflux transporter [Clostridia bacterium]